MRRLLTWLNVLSLVAASAHSAEDSEAGVCLLQFQVNLSSSKGSSLDGTVSIPGGGRLQLNEHFRLGAKKAKLMYLSSSHVTQSEGRHVKLMWFCSALLLIAFLSLLWHLVPLLLRLAIRRQRHSVESDAPEADVDGTTADPLANPSVTKQSMPVVLYGMLYIICSCTLIKYNDFLMTKGRFPYAVNLALGHQASGSLLLFILFKLRPSLYPSLAGTGERRMNWLTFCQSLLPVATCFSGQLVLSNVAYTYTSVAFIQMMKEGNMVLVYMGSLLAGLESFNSVRARVLLCLLLSTALTIQGQISFSPTGFVVQGISQAMEATKIVLQSVLLSAAGSRLLDPHSYNLLVQPTTALLLGGFMCLASIYIPAVPLASWDEYVIWMPHLIANCCVALALNLVIAFFIANSSAVGFIVAGIAKDICLIVADVVLSGTKVSTVQYTAFGLQVSFVVAYSLLKLYARQLEPVDTRLVKK